MRAIARKQCAAQHSRKQQRRRAAAQLRVRNGRSRQPATATRAHRRAVRRKRRRPALRVDRPAPPASGSPSRNFGVIIGGLEPLARRQRVDRHLRLGWAVKTRRKFRARRAVETRGNGLRGRAAARRARRIRPACAMARSVSLRTSRARASPSACCVWPESATTRRSMSTNRPDSGRFDHVVSAVTWTRTRAPCRAARR